MIDCFSSSGVKVSNGVLKAFIRKTINHTVNVSEVKNNNRTILKGKTALITGASRGLGAILSKLLAAMSCKVIINFQYSLEDALNLKDEIIAGGGDVELWQGDISDLNWLNKKKEELMASWRFFDIIVCNACTALNHLTFELDTISRINAYVFKNFEMASNPLSLFAPMFNKQNGYGLIISSDYNAITFKREYPHYVSVKAAIEALVQSIAIKYRKIRWLIVRPPRMLTNMTNSPMGNQNSADPVMIATKICDRLFSNDWDKKNNIEIFNP
ncbi:hypothetical protein FACS189442_4380 [Spirochaetia bacterium]|nr:hypothetical protein FACS189442_4380 [Spirochaetia bacterium]